MQSSRNEDKSLSKESKVIDNNYNSSDDANNTSVSSIAQLSDQSATSNNIYLRNKEDMEIHSSH